MLSWVVFFIAVALLAWYYIRGPAAGQFRRVDRRRRGGVDNTERWRAVSVVCPSGVTPCKAVRPVLERRYLVREAPPIPARDCADLGCRCYYKHYQDRRQGDRRAGHDLHESVSAGLGISDRRTGRDRRHRQPIASILPQ